MSWSCTPLRPPSELHVRRVTAVWKNAPSCIPGKGILTPLASSEDARQRQGFAIPVFCRTHEMLLVPTFDSRRGVNVQRLTGVVVSPRKPNPEPGRVKRDEPLTSFIRICSFKERSG